MTLELAKLICDRNIIDLELTPPCYPIQQRTIHFIRNLGHQSLVYKVVDGNNTIVCSIPVKQGCGVVRSQEEPILIVYKNQITPQKNYCLQFLEMVAPDNTKSQRESFDNEKAV